jgi:hypothetical protein
MKLSEAAREVIDQARAIRAYWDAELPKRHPNFPLVNPGEDSGPPPPEEDELRKLLASLPAEDVYKLALMMHLGRGDFGTDELAENFENLKASLETPELAMTHLINKAPLAEYLSDGLEELERHGIDVDQLDLVPVN